MPALKKIVQDAGSIGLKALSVQASISYAQALLATNHADAARPATGRRTGTGRKGLACDSNWPVPVPVGQGAHACWQAKGRGAPLSGGGEDFAVPEYGSAERAISWTGPTSKPSTARPSLPRAAQRTLAAKLCSSLTKRIDADLPREKGSSGVRLSANSRTAPDRSSAQSITVDPAGRWPQDPPRGSVGANLIVWVAG